MEIFKPLSPVIPVFLLVAVGFVFAHWKKISLTSVTEIIVYLGTPSLVFTSLASRPLFAGDIAILFSGVVIVFVRPLEKDKTGRKIRLDSAFFSM